MWSYPKPRRHFAAEAAAVEAGVAEVEIGAEITEVADVVVAAVMNFGYSL